MGRGEMGGGKLSAACSSSTNQVARGGGGRGGTMVAGGADVRIENGMFGIAHQNDQLICYTGDMPP